MNRLNRVLMFSLFAFLVLSPAPIFAQITFVKTIGPNSSKSTGTSIAVTVPASGVAAGNSVIVSLAMDPASGTVSCIDSASNSYAVDRDQVNGSGTSGVRAVILSTHNVTALASGNTITCTHPSVAARALSASEFSGLAVSGTKDQATSATGQSTSPSSGNTGPTTQAAELLIGAIGVEGPSGDTFTPGASYTTIGRGGTTGGNAATNITINPEYRIVSTTGAYAATGTMSNSRKWAAAIVTYKAKPPPVINTVTPNSGPFGTPVTIAGSNFGATQGTSTVTFNGVTATPTSWSASSITVPVPANASTGPVVVTVSGVASAGVNFTLTYSPRVNAGGSSYTDGSGNYWAADRAYGSGPWGYTAGTAFSTSDPISNTNDDVLYQWVRYGTFGYKFDLSNGLYDVTLHFSEVGWTAPNQRLFNVSIEGTQVLANYDIFAEVGHDAATSKTFYSVNVQDGQLNIDFTTVVNAAIISAIQISPARPTKLVITSVNGGNPPGAGVPFPVTIQAQNPTGTPMNVTVATNVSLSVTSGDSNALGGTVSGTIPLGSNQLNLTGVTYSKNDYGVILRAAATSGESLSAGDSAQFNVSIGSPTKLGILFQPGNSTTSGAITGPPTVAVQDASGNTITTSTAPITVAIGANPGGGTLTGTTVRNASSGVAAFADLRIDQAGNGYTLTATSPGLSGATTTAFNIVSAGNVSGTVTKSAGGGAINGALVEALQSAVVKGTASTNSSGSYTITGLVPGNYDIRGTAGGFTPQTQNGISVSGGATATANFTLAVATPTAGIVYLYDELQRLKSVIDPVGEAATYSYDAVGNLLSITRNNATQTSVIDFNPNKAAIGSAVTIYGTGYSTTPSQNAVTFNGVTATVTSSTLTQIQTTVPVGATDGPIAVTSPSGSAMSSTSFVVIGAPAGAPTITNISPSIATVGSAVTITGTNFDTTPTNNDVRFNPTLAAVTNASTTSIETTVPISARPGKISVDTLIGNATSSNDFFLVPAPYTASQVDYTGRITIGGVSHTVTISNTPSKIALVIFDGKAGQNVGLGFNSFTLPGGTDFNVYDPDGTVLVAAQTLSNVHMNLPMTGTYTVLFNPNGATGNVTFTLSEDVAPVSIAINGASATITVDRVGQWARLKFDAAANQTVSFGVNSATLPGGTDMYLYRPDGSLIQSFQTMSNFRLQLPSFAGTYTMLFNPGGATGNATFTLSEDADAGSITVNGDTATIAVNRVGQWAKLTFEGTADQIVSLGVNSYTLPGGTDTYIYRPDGQLFQFVETLGFRLQLPSQTGTYTMLFNPGGAMGTATFTLSEDVTATISMTGPPVTLEINRVGQWGRLTFDGLAGQYVSMGINSFTLPGGTDSYIYKPDGSLFLFIETLGGFHVQLPVNGTYTVLFNPGGNLGNVTATLSEDVDAGTININGSSVTANIDRVGQLARVRFTGTATQSLTLHAVDSTLGTTTDVYVYKPDGTELTNHLNFGTGAQLAITPPVDGIYTILVIPRTIPTGSLTMSLTNP